MIRRSGWRIPDCLRSVPNTGSWWCFNASISLGPGQPQGSHTFFLFSFTFVILNWNNGSVCTVHFLCFEFRTFFPARSYKGSLSEVIYPWDHLFRNAAQISQIMLMSYSSYLSELKWKILQTRYICHSPTSNNWQFSSRDRNISIKGGIQSRKKGSIFYTILKHTQKVG